MGKLDLSDWGERRQLLIAFQKELVTYFPEGDYNVFVFGSYIRPDFVAGKSDIDMIIYCDDRKKQEVIADFCRTFFQEAGIESDVLEYFYSESAYIFVNGILNSFPMTEYYPEKLKCELYLMSKEFRQSLEEKRRKGKYYHWAYEKSVLEVEKSVQNSLMILRNQAEKIMDSYDRYCKCDDPALRDDLVESMASRLNRFTQAYMDVIAFIRINSEQSMYEESFNYYLRYFNTLEISKTEDMNGIIETLKKRNSIVHDYFDIEQLNYELVKGVASYGNGLTEIADALLSYCSEHFSEANYDRNI